MVNDETTTSKQPADEGADNALPNEQVEQEADNTETSTESNDGAQTNEKSNDKSDSALPEVDDKLKSFAKGQGIEDMSELSDREQKLLKVAYDNNASFQRSRQKESQLEKDMVNVSDQYAEQQAQATGENPELLKRVQRMEVRDTVRDFFDKHPDAREHEEDLVQVLANRPHLVGDLDAAYAVYQTQNMDDVKSQGKTEALQSLAQNQQAAAPKGNAVNPTDTSSSSRITSKNVDQVVSQMSPEEYQKRLPEINAALAQ